MHALFATYSVIKIKINFSKMNENYNLNEEILYVNWINVSSVLLSVIGIFVQMQININKKKYDNDNSLNHLLMNGKYIN